MKKDIHISYLNKELDLTIDILKELSEMLAEYKIPDNLIDYKSISRNMRDLIESRGAILTDVCCLIDDLVRK